MMLTSTLILYFLPSEKEPYEHSADVISRSAELLPSSANTTKSQPVVHLTVYTSYPYVQTEGENEHGAKLWYKN